jgi:hypothetical protein
MITEDLCDVCGVAEFYCGCLALVEALPYDAIFVSDSQDVKHYLDNYVPEDQRGDWGSLFVLAKDGQILEVWGLEGVVAELGKDAYRIYMDKEASPY